MIFFLLQISNCGVHRQINKWWVFVSNMMEGTIYHTHTHIYLYTHTHTHIYTHTHTHIFICMYIHRHANWPAELLLYFVFYERKTMLELWDKKKVQLLSSCGSTPVNADVLRPHWWEFKNGLNSSVSCSYDACPGMGDVDTIEIPALYNDIFE